jgi:hypothetical protein
MSFCATRTTRCRRSALPPVCRRMRPSEPRAHVYAADFLHERSWQGLDQRLGQDAPSMLEQGRSGIARGYGEDEQQP